VALAQSDVEGIVLEQFGKLGGCGEGLLLKVKLHL